jgi:integrase
MPRGIHKLSALRIGKIKTRGFYADGGNLYLQVSKAGTKSWVFRFKESGRTRDMGLGPIHTLSLAEARERATECRKLRLDRVDPIEQRKAERAARRLATSKNITFDECAAACLESNRAQWSIGHADQWRATLETYASPVIGKLPTQAIDTGLVMKILEPIWITKTETASRLRGRIEKVLDWATVREYRRGENPARWHGHLDHLLPKPGKVQVANHHASLPYQEIAAFMARLAKQEGTIALALAFTILTGVRANETLGAKWGEIDRATAVWTIPAERTKISKEHRVPLSSAAMAILEKLPPSQGEFIFPGLIAGKPLAHDAMRALLVRMKANVTVHGFRSTFRVWAAEQTNFPSEIPEAALAHSVGGKVLKAYLRTSFFDKRRELMDAWAAYCGGAQ